MKYLSIVLFAVGCLVMVGTVIFALGISNEDWITHHAEGHKLLAITFFAAAAAAQLIWGERRSA